MRIANAALRALRHHVTGAVERGEAEPIVEIPARCRRCGFTELEHRGYDGACPACEDDAAYYREDNEG